MLLLPALAIAVPLAPPDSSQVAPARSRSPQQSTRPQLGRRRDANRLHRSAQVSLSDRSSSRRGRRRGYAGWLAGAGRLAACAASDARASPGSKSDPSSTTWPLVPVLHDLLTCSFMKRSRPRSLAGSSVPRSSFRTRLVSGPTHLFGARSCTSWNTCADVTGGSISRPV